MPRGKPLDYADMGDAASAIARFKTNREAAEHLGISERQLRRRLLVANANNIDPEHPNKDSPFAIDHAPPIGSLSDQIWEIKSDKNNCYKFGAFSDLHAGSKYCRWDVRGDLTKRAEDFEAFAILDGGNWCEGQAPFNRHTLVCNSLDDQLDLLAEKYPKTKIPTYAITADDHEGWWIKREGIDIGRHTQAIMRQAGHAWTDIGYVESNILLTNTNTGTGSILRVMHPRGGSSYATSYKAQKIIESLEGGDKPAVLLIAHYHKLLSGCVRNVWFCLTGCQQDQTPFLRATPVEAHLGGILLELQQDPETGAIISFKPDMIKYYNRGYYVASGRTTGRWTAHGPIRQVPRSVNAA